MLDADALRRETAMEHYQALQAQIDALAAAARDVREPSLPALLRAWLEVSWIGQAEHLVAAAEQLVPALARTPLGADREIRVQIWAFALYTAPDGLALLDTHLAEYCAQMRADVTAYLARRQGPTAEPQQGD